MPARRLPVLAVLLAVAAAAVATRPARAQQPGASELAAARSLFERGLRAARAERWDEAREAFSRSLALAPLATTRLNLAGAQVQSGRLVEGAESYRQFLSAATGGRAARYRAEAERALAEVEARIPSVHLRIAGLAASDALRLDGEPLSQAAVGVTLPLDPGEHHLVVLRGGRTRAETRFTLAEAERSEVRLDARGAGPPRRTAGRVARRRPVGPPLATREDEAPGDGAGRAGGGGVLASPWLWIGLGVLVAGGVTAGVVVASSGGADAYQGNLGPGRVGFR